MAKVSIERKEIEVTLTLSEDEALAMLALTGCVKSGNAPVEGIYKALHGAVEGSVPTIWAYRVKGSPLIEVVKQHG